MNKRTKIVLGVIVFIGVAVWAYFVAARVYEFSNQDIAYMDTNSEVSENMSDDMLAAASSLSSKCKDAKYKATHKECLKKVESSAAWCRNKYYREVHKECQGNKSFGDFVLFVATGYTRK